MVKETRGRDGRGCRGQERKVNVGHEVRGEDKGDGDKMIRG